MTREELLEYAERTYGTKPDCPWDSGDSPVLRHGDSKKWYGLVMRVPYAKFGLSRAGDADVLNVKCDPLLAGSYRLEPGIFPAYHMNHYAWLSVLLDGTVPDGTVKELLDLSFSLTAPKQKRKAGQGPAEWLVPANPKYYDIESAFRESRVIDWKQSTDVHVGDTVYLYVAAPVSAILYRCRAVEVNIPYRYADENVRMTKLMRIELLEEYDRKRFTFGVLRAHGVLAVRGPRSVPESLSEALWPKDERQLPSCQKPKNSV